MLGIMITDAIVKEVPQKILSNSYLGYGVNFTSCCDSHDKCATQPLSLLGPCPALNSFYHTSVQYKV